MNCQRLRLPVLALMLIAPAAIAQPAGPPPLPPLVNPDARYSSASAQIEVGKPLAALWSRIGKFCDFGHWVNEPCEILSGKDGEMGAVRLVNNRFIEVMVATTAYSYTYAFPPRLNAPFNMFHGTVEARSLGKNRSLVIYTQVWDNSALASDAARSRDIETRKEHLLHELESMKRLNEPPRN